MNSIFTQSGLSVNIKCAVAETNTYPTCNNNQLISDLAKKIKQYNFNNFIYQWYWNIPQQYHNKFLDETKFQWTDFATLSLLKQLSTLLPLSYYTAQYSSTAFWLKIYMTDTNQGEDYPLLNSLKPHILKCMMCQRVFLWGQRSYCHGEQ
jgi:hypothetical protein